jgi:hypothetical protein
VIVEDLDRLTREKPLAAHGLIVELLQKAQCRYLVVGKISGSRQTPTLTISIQYSVRDQKAM